MDEKQIAELEAEESMFVQIAQGITSDGGTLAMHGIMPSTLYFSDRPQRIVGLMATGDFVDLWDEGDNSFQADPPNAVLAFLEPGDEVPEDAVVVIREPRTRSRSSTGRFRRRPGLSPCSSTRSAGRSRPCRCAACGDAIGEESDL